MFSNQALRFDHETAQSAVKEIVEGMDIAPSSKLAALYGARLAMIHGGIPDCFLGEVDAAIRYWERNRDFNTPSVEQIENAEEEAPDSRSGRGD